jgi:hypothetical protein
MLDVFRSMVCDLATTLVGWEAVGVDEHLRSFDTAKFARSTTILC